MPLLCLWQWDLQKILKEGGCRKQSFHDTGRHISLQNPQREEREKKKERSSSSSSLGQGCVLGPSPWQGDRIAIPGSSFGLGSREKRSASLSCSSCGWNPLSTQCFLIPRTCVLMVTPGTMALPHLWCHRTCESQKLSTLTSCRMLCRQIDVSLSLISKAKSSYTQHGVPERKVFWVLCYPHGRMESSLSCGPQKQLLHRFKELLLLLFLIQDSLRNTQSYASPPTPLAVPQRNPSLILPSE